MSVLLMFNESLRAATPARDLLPQRQAVYTSFKARMKSLPLPPDSLRSLLESLEHGFASAVEASGGISSVSYIRDNLFDAPGREAEAHALWNEAVATAAFAWNLTANPGPSAAAASLGGLLHRAGEAVSLKLLALSEADAGIRIDAPSKADLTAQSAWEIARRLVKEWDLPPPVATCVLGWQRFGEFAEVSPEASAVYFGHLLAAELLHPEFSAPGALDEAGAESGLNTAAISQARAGASRVRELVRALD